MVRRISFLVLGVILSLFYGCAGNNSVNQTSTSETFTEDYNPPYLDVLWVVNNQSPMYRVHDHLVQQAGQLFTNLDAVPKNYQMAITTTDMSVHPGTVYPTTGPLTKDAGSLSDRVAIFGSLISNIINLQTGATDDGFAGAYTALRSQNFKTRDGVPLLLIFISDADDHSVDNFGTTPVDDYYQQFLTLKGGNANLLRVYSINYEPLPSGVTIQTTTDRCATRYSADIDMSGFQNRYFDLANEAAGTGSTANVTGDLCGSFSDQIDFSGLRLKQPILNFQLKANPQPSTISVTVMGSDGSTVSNLTWNYDAKNNGIDFVSAPPEGSIIQVTYTAQ